MGKGVPRNVTAKSVKALNKLSACSSANSKSGALIRQKQLAKCQQVRTQIHPNKLSNLSQTAAGLLYRPKCTKTKAPSSSVKMENQRKRALKKSLTTGSSSAKLSKIMKTPSSTSIKRSTPSMSGLGSSSSPSPSSSASTSRSRDAQTLASDPISSVLE